ncbi:uncharacterized protein LOC132192758 [Neocloeon triangulifer]|uniref:uncharacterized protein LOC132192758 n=1 Tax=Neocloeon triangulifer TaxID=2078957 RepID=UPI00286F0628|nr:uncharacterized protein LOC132192758 [Neocloeon triangulifer]
MLKLAGLGVLFLGMVQVVSAHKRGMQNVSPDVLKQLAIDEPQFCIPFYLMMAQQCVNVPKLFYPKMFKNCRNRGKSWRQGKLTQFSGGKRRGYGGKRNSKNRQAREARKGFGQRMRQMAAELTPERGGCNGNCMAECVMNKTNHLDQNGNIILENLLANYTKALDFLTAGSKAAWSPLIANIINTCMNSVQTSTEVLASTTTTTSGSVQSTPASVAATTFCKSDSLRLITCIQREFILQAPNSELITASNTPAGNPILPTCADRKAQLKGCNFNYMLSSDQLRKYFGESRKNRAWKSGYRGRLTQSAKQGGADSSEENGGQTGNPDVVEEGDDGQ